MAPWGYSAPSTFTRASIAACSMAPGIQVPVHRGPRLALCSTVPLATCVCKHVQATRRRAMSSAGRRGYLELVAAPTALGSPWIWGLAIQRFASPFSSEIFSRSSSLSYCTWMHAVTILTTRARIGSPFRITVTESPTSIHWSARGSVEEASRLLRWRLL